jgi:rhodanese-related sulfurtransferase
MDVLATALRAGLTVFDLEELELSYAPAFGSAKDPVNMAGFVAANLLRGDADLWELEELDSLGDAMLLDVRSPSEFAAGTIPGAVNVPVDELRVRLSELPMGKELRVFCQVGLRGYVACRILGQKGYHCRNLSGGYKLYGLWVNARPVMRRSKIFFLIIGMTLLKTPYSRCFKGTLTNNLESLPDLPLRSSFCSPRPPR